MVHASFSAAFSFTEKHSRMLRVSSTCASPFNIAAVAPIIVQFVFISFDAACETAAELFFWTALHRAHNDACYEVAVGQERTSRKRTRCAVQGRKVKRVEKKFFIIEIKLNFMYVGFLLQPTTATYERAQREKVESTKHTGQPNIAIK